MNNSDYFAMPGLSYSGIKDLLVSPLHYWHRNVNPEREERKETPAMRLGSALHCAVLEPKRFEQQYVRELEMSEYPDAIVTMEDLRAFIVGCGGKPRGTVKAGLIAQALSEDPTSENLIWDLIREKHARENGGRIVLTTDEWRRVEGCSRALLNEPALTEILKVGAPEVVMTATHQRTGVLLKAKMDWVNPALIVDLKTFSQQRGKPTEKTVTDALWYEGYLLQAYFYCYIRSLQPDGWKLRDSRFLFAFVESDEPHDVRLRELTPSFGAMNMYWHAAGTTVHRMIELYASCRDRFDDRPWRTNTEIAPLCDEEIPQLAWA